jgi:hypothetical protein
MMIIIIGNMLSLILHEILHKVYMLTGHVNGSFIGRYPQGLFPSNNGLIGSFFGLAGVQSDNLDIFSAGEIPRLKKSKLISLRHNPGSCFAF